MMTDLSTDRASSKRDWQIVAAYFTIAGEVIPFAGDAPSPINLRERVDAAARAGFCGIGLETNDLRHCVEQFGTHGIRRMLGDAGLAYFELEVLTDWFADGEARARSDRDREILMRAAAEIETAQIKVIGAVGSNPPLSKMADEFGALCREASAAGTSINLEIYPDSNVRDLGTAQDLIAAAGQPNGGLLIDIWHMNRGNIRYEDLVGLPAGMIRAVEVDDGAADQVGTVFEDTIRRRLLPGDGAFDVQRFLRCVWDAGYSGPIGVEVLSDAQRCRPVAAAAAAAFDASARELDAAAAKHRSSDPASRASAG